MGRLCERFICLTRGHMWIYHFHVRDWYCDRCRTRRKSIGVSK